MWLQAITHGHMSVFNSVQACTCCFLPYFLLSSSPSLPNTAKKQKNKQKKEQMAQLDQTNIFTTKGKLIFSREKGVALSPVTVQLQQSG